MSVNFAQFTTPFPGFVRVSESQMGLQNDQQAHQAAMADKQAAAESSSYEQRFRMQQEAERKQKGEVLLAKYHSLLAAGRLEEAEGVRQTLVALGFPIPPAAPAPKKGQPGYDPVVNASEESVPVSMNPTGAPMPSSEQTPASGPIDQEADAGEGGQAMQTLQANSGKSVDGPVRETFPASSGKVDGPVRETLPAYPGKVGGPVRETLPVKGGETIETMRRSAHEGIERVKRGEESPHMFEAYKGTIRFLDEIEAGLANNPKKKPDKPYSKEQVAYSEDVERRASMKKPDKPYSKEQVAYSEDVERRASMSDDEYNLYKAESTELGDNPSADEIAEYDGVYDPEAVVFAEDYHRAMIEQDKAEEVQPTKNRVKGKTALDTIRQTVEAEADPADAPVISASGSTGIAAREAQKEADRNPDEPSYLDRVRRIGRSRTDALAKMADSISPEAGAYVRASQKAGMTHEAILADPTFQKLMESPEKLKRAAAGAGRTVVQIGKAGQDNTIDRIPEVWDIVMGDGSGQMGGMKTHTGIESATEGIQAISVALNPANKDQYLNTTLISGVIRNVLQSSGEDRFSDQDFRSVGGDPSIADEVNKIYSNIVKGDNPKIGLSQARKIKAALEIQKEVLKKRDNDRYERLVIALENETYETKSAKLAQAIIATWPEAKNDKRVTGRLSGYRVSTTPTRPVQVKPKGGSAKDKAADKAFDDVLKGDF